MGARCAPAPLATARRSPSADRSVPRSSPSNGGRAGAQRAPPIESERVARTLARVVRQEYYGALGWPYESEYVGTTVLHNFYFTTEIHIEFVYRAGDGQRFE